MIWVSSYLNAEKCLTGRNNKTKCVLLFMNYLTQEIKNADSRLFF